MVRFIILSGLRVDVNTSCEIYYSPNDCQMNIKSHDFYLHELLILREK